MRYCDGEGILTTLGTAAFFGAAFFGAAVLVAALFGAAFLAAVLGAALVLETAAFLTGAFLVTLDAGAFSVAVALAGAFLVAAAFVAVAFLAGALAAGFGAATLAASLVVPEGPVDVLVMCDGEGKWQRRTLWLSEGTLLNTGLQSSVEGRIEHGILGVDGVVCLDVFLDLGAAIHMLVRAHTNKRRVESKRDLTLIRFSLLSSWSRRKS